MREHERKAGDKINKRKNDLRRGEIQEKATFQEVMKGMKGQTDSPLTQPTRH